MAVDINKICNEVISPSYIFSEEEFASRAALVRESFGENVNLCFSIKANPFLLGIMPDQISKVEVCSPGELDVCKRLKLPPEMIIFSGVNKSKEEIRVALEYGVRNITAESKKHIDYINSAAIEMNIECDLLLRLSDESQFGIDGDELLGYIKNRDSYKGFKIVGLHYFTGTQKRRPSALIKEIDKFMAYIDRVEADTNFKIERIEYGTGLAVDYFSEDAMEQEKARIEEIAPKIKELSKKADLTVEMGRFFAAPCGYYITEVVDTKVNDGVHYAIVDGGIHQLKYDGQTQGMQIPEITHIKNSQSCDEVGSGTNKWTLCGSLCTTADVIARSVEFTDLNCKDLLVFHRTGAYSMDEGISLLLSRDMPSIYILDKANQLNKVRSRVDTYKYHVPDNM